MPPRLERGRQYRRGLPGPCRRSCESPPQGDSSIPCCARLSLPRIPSRTCAPMPRQDPARLQSPPRPEAALILPLELSLRIGNCQQLLAEVRASEQPDDGLGSVLQSGCEIKFVLDLTLRVPLPELRQRFGITLGEMKDQKSFHPRAAS